MRAIIQPPSYISKLHQPYLGYVHTFCSSTVPGYDCRWAPSEHALTPEFGQRARAYLQGRTFVFCLFVCLSVFQIQDSTIT